MVVVWLRVVTLHIIPRISTIFITCKVQIWGAFIKRCIHDVTNESRHDKTRSALQ